MAKRQIGFLARYGAEEQHMPKVGGKKFAYTEKGKAAAEKAASKQSVSKKLKKAR